MVELIRFLIGALILCIGIPIVVLGFYCMDKETRESILNKTVNDMKK